MQAAFRIDRSISADRRRIIADPPAKVQQVAASTVEQILSPHGRRQLRWVFAVAAFPVATLLRIFLNPVLPPGLPFITYYPMVMLIAYVAGRWPAIIATGLAAFAATYLFVEPIGSFEMDLPNGLAIGLFLVISATTIVIFRQIETLQRRIGIALAQSETVAAESAKSADEATASRQRLDAIFRQLPVGIIEMDLNGIVLLGNERVRAMLGQPIEEIIGSPLSAHFHIGDRAGLTHAFEHLVMGERSITLPIRPASVGLPQLLLHVTLARDGKGSPQSVLAVIEQTADRSPDSVLGMPPKSWLRRPGG